MLNLVEDGRVDWREDHGMMSGGERDTRMIMCRPGIPRSIWHTAFILLILMLSGLSEPSFEGYHGQIRHLRDELIEEILCPWILAIIFPQAVPLYSIHGTGRHDLWSHIGYLGYCHWPEEEKKKKQTEFIDQCAVPLVEMVWAKSTKNCPPYSCASSEWDIHHALWDGLYLALCNRWHWGPEGHFWIKWSIKWRPLLIE